MELDPKRIRIQPIEGSGNIASGVFSDRWWMPLFVRGHFKRTGGSGTETATLTLDVESWRGSTFNTRLGSITAAGNGGDVKWRILKDDLDCFNFLMEPRDKVLLNWTNPDSPEIYLGVLFGFYELP